MALFGSILRARRGDFHLLLIAALVALLIVPGASHAAIAPQNAQAVLLWLQSEGVAPATAPLAKASELLAISRQKAEKTPQKSAEMQVSSATFHCGQHLAPPAPENTTRHELPFIAPRLERHAVAHLSGVRTNRRLI